MADPAKTEDQNLLPVQAYFDVDGEFQTFIGQGQPFYATVNPDQSGLHITNSTIDSTTIGATTPSTGVFTNVSTTTGTISTAPIGNTDITNKQYVDSIAQGLNPKQAVKCATTANITLSGLQTIDTYTTLAGDRVLVKNQSTSSENGIYIAGSSTWTRSTDMDVWAEVPGAYTVILNGTQAQTGWVCTASDTGTIGVTAMPWVQFSGSATYYAGTGLSLSANTFSITNTGVTAATKGSASKTVTATVNAQGQLTSLTDQDIAIAGTQITSGLVSPTYGGTGVNNGSNTLTWNASYSLNQSVASGAAPTFTGTNFSAIPNAALSNSAITVNGTSISLGGSGTITAVNPYALTLGTGLSGTSYNGSAAVTAAIANTGVTANSYTIMSATVNAQGQLTAASSASTTGTGSVVLANGPSISAPTIDGANPYIQFANGSAVALAAGRMWYDGTTGSLNFGMGGGNITQQVGEEIFVYGKASAAITEGQLVMKTGVVGASGVITFAPTSANITDDNVIIGIATENIALNGFGRVTAFGVVHGINTSAFTDGATLWYDPTSSTGGMTATKPSAPNVKCEVGIVINAGSGSSGSIQVEIIHGTKLGGSDSNVGFGTLANGDLIQYNSSLGYWTNVATSTVSVGTATNLAGGGAGYVPYQTGSGATSFVSAGTSGQVLTSNGTSAPTWTTPTAYATVTDDTTTNATRYPLFAAATSGNLTTEYTSSTKYQFNPSTGVLTATSFSGAGAFTTLSASSTVSGTGFSTYLASPPAIGGTAAAAGTFTTLTATADSAFTSTGALQLPVGTTAQQPTGAAGKLRFNSTTSQFEGYTGAAWSSVGGATISDDTTTNATRYPLFASTTSGTATTVYTSSTELKYNPSTGTLSALQVSATNGIHLNSQTVAANYTIATGDNGLSAGPVSVASGITVTVSTGSVWTIV